MFMPRILALTALASHALVGVQGQGSSFWSYGYCPGGGEAGATARISGDSSPGSAVTEGMCDQAGIEEGAAFAQFCPNVEVGECLLFSACDLEQNQYTNPDEQDGCVVNQITASGCGAGDNG